MTRRPWTILNYGFRSFFLLTGLAAVILIAGWLALLHGLRWPGAPLNGVDWHAHELLFGFGLGAVAGFLLTAMAAWTGRPPVQGSALGILVGAWLAARLALLFGGALPVWLLLPLALAFPVLLALTVGHDILAGGNRRNYPLVVVVGTFALLDALVLLAYTGLLPEARVALYLALHLLVLLIVIIGGRIIPAFSANWLRMQGADRLPVVRPWLERTVIGLTLAVALVDSLLPVGSLLLPLAAAAAMAHGLRLIGWRGWLTGSNPLLLILHLGYAWLIVGYALLALQVLVPAVTHSAALHAFGTGAVGTMILAVMTRVTLGHTGRALSVGRPTVLLYGCVLSAGLLRLLAALYPAAHTLLLGLSGLFWIAAFGLFLALYGPLLCRPRADGRPERVTRPPTPTRYQFSPGGGAR